MSKLPKLPSLDEMGLPSLEELEEKKVTRKRLKMPKSQYDSEGNPILTVPDLDDVDLTSEIDKYFGKGVEVEEDD